MAALLSSAAHLLLLRTDRLSATTSASSSSSSSASSHSLLLGYQSVGGALPSTRFALGSRRRHCRQLPVFSSSDLLAKGERRPPSGRSWTTGRRRRSCCCSSLRGAAAARSSSSLQWQESLVTMDDRRKLLQQKGCIVWITGLSGSGKSTVAFAMDRILNSMAKVSYVLDGDKIREGLCKDLGFSAEDRRENIRRVGETAALFADAGLIAVVSFISPYKRDRDIVRELVPTGNFIEVFMDVPLEVCEERDAKGLYKLARQGVIKAFTGIDDPYEKPVNPEIVIKAVNEHGVCISPDEMARIIIHHLSEKGFLSE
ncbi:hypothetical protein Mapa_006921 [Marchantia paleacea]|nr:hypothetical protein Mapa_006921 [Marchantia paleacea]